MESKGEREREREREGGMDGFEWHSNTVEEIKTKEATQLAFLLRYAWEMGE